MSLEFYPDYGTVLICDFSTGFQPPEMVKKRPVVIVSPRKRYNAETVTIVPLSTRPPHAIHAWQHLIDSSVLPKHPDEAHLGEVRYDNQCGSLAAGSDEGEDKRAAYLFCATPYSIGYRGDQAWLNGSPCFDLTAQKGLDLPCSHSLGLEDHLMAGRSLIRKQVSSALFFFNQF